MKVLKSMGFTVFIYMDSYRKTKEVRDKWKKRIKSCIINEQKKVPIGHGQILSEYFRKYGAKILFSYEEDNDDTLGYVISTLKLFLDIE